MKRMTLIAGLLILGLSATALTPACTVHAEESQEETLYETEVYDSRQTTPEAAVPETQTPKTETEPATPETQLPETQDPETQAPETQAPETQTPETQAPETQTPDTQTPSSENLEGSVIITRKKMKKGVSAGKKCTITLLIRNTATQADIKDAQLIFEMPDGVSLDASEETDTISVSDIPPSSVKEVKIKLDADQNLGTISTLAMKVQMPYTYQSGKQTRQGLTKENILLPVAAADGTTNDNFGDAGGSYDGGGYDSAPASGETKQIDSPTPNIIISEYDYGNDLKAGDEFTLKLVIKNTSSSISVSNMIMSAEPGDALVIENSSNSYYIDKIAPQETITKSIKLRALPDGKLENSKIDIGFRYEYVSKDTRNQTTSSEKLSIPVNQPDRFSIGDAHAEDVTSLAAGEEATLTIPYVNKGKTVINNLEARIETDMSCEETYKYLGNVDAGTSGTIDFIVTPSEAGTQKAKITVSYEDSSNQVQTETKELSLEIPEAETYSEDMMGDVSANDMGNVSAYSEEPAASTFPVIPVAACGAGVLLLGGGLLRHRMKRKKQLLLDYQDKDEE